MERAAFGKVIAEKRITFSAAEVNLHTITEDGALKFITTRCKAIKGRAYNLLLLQKLKDVSSAENKFIIRDPFKWSGLHNKVCYIKCSHDVRMPVIYRNSHLKLDHPLTMTWKITCNDCVLSETNRTNDNPVAIVNSAPKIRYTEAPTTSYLNQSKQNGNISSGLNLTSRFKEIAAKVVEDVNKTMYEFFTVCELTENPLETAIKRKANLGICVNVAAINALNIEISNNLMPGDKIDIQNKRDETIAVRTNQQEGIIENEPLVTEESQGVQENPENEHQENLDVLPKEATNCQQNSTEVVAAVFEEVFQNGGAEEIKVNSPAAIESNKKPTRRYSVTLEEGFQPLVERDESDDEKEISTPASTIEKAEIAVINVASKVRQQPKRKVNRNLMDSYSPKAINAQKKQKKALQSQKI